MWPQCGASAVAVARLGLVPMGSAGGPGGGASRRMRGLGAASANRDAREEAVLEGRAGDPTSGFAGRVLGKPDRLAFAFAAGANFSPPRC